MTVLSEEKVDAKTLPTCELPGEANGSCRRHRGWSSRALQQRKAAMQ